MTVQDLINKSVRLIDDYENITDYGTDQLDNVSTIVGELMRLEIGIKPIEYVTEPPDTAPYTPDNEDYTPVELPADLTGDDQIMGIQLGYDGEDYIIRTETHSGALYLLVPADYTGNVLVRYMAASPNFTALTDTLPISDAAVNNVARFGLAELLAPANASEYYDMLATKYREAKALWRRRDYNSHEVRDVYGY